MPAGGFDFLTFDCYGTLIDWESGLAHAFMMEAARDDITLQREAIIEAYMQVEPEIQAGPFTSYREVLTQSAREVAHRLAWSLDPGRAHFLADSLPSWQPFADTNAALARLSKRYRLGIISNVDDDLIAATQKHLYPHFDLVVTAQQVRSYKPDPAHFTECERRIGGKKGWIHVAASYYHDVEPCIKKKIPVIWVNRHGETLEASQKKPDAEVKNLREAAKLIEEIAQAAA